MSQNQNKKTKCGVLIDIDKETGALTTFSTFNSVESMKILKQAIKVYGKRIQEEKK